MSKKRIKAVLVDKYEHGPFGESRWIGEALQLPATAYAYEQLVEQVAKAESDYALATCGDGQNWNDGECARRILRAIGITPPKKGQP